MDANLKQRLSVILISLCVIAGTINTQAGMLTKPGNIKESGKLKTVPVQPSLTKVPVEKEITGTKSVLVSPADHKWQAYKGESLQSLMVRWAGYAGYQVAWDVPYDYQINASFDISGDFTGVVKQLFDEFSNSDRPMKIDIYNQQKLVHVGPL